MGAPLFNGGSAGGFTGAAYIFSRSGTTWTLQTQFYGSKRSDLFIGSVAVSGDTVAGASMADNFLSPSGTDQGVAFVYTRSGTTWTQQTQLTAADGVTNDNFGVNVDIAGDTIIVGAYRVDVGANTDQGSAYVFVQPAAPTAAAVSISGRVSTAQDSGLTNALVTLTDLQGNSQTVKTGKSGAFRFTNVTAGETYILTVKSKRYTFAPRIVTTNENLTDVNLTANQ